LAPAVVVVAVVAELLVPLLQQPEVAAARPVLLLQFPARLLREAQLLRPVPLPQQPEVAAVRPAALPQEAEVAVAVVLVQGLVASEILRSR
jgi:hypothetical protein